jgi:hypothetical protein
LKLGTSAGRQGCPSPKIASSSVLDAAARLRNWGGVKIADSDHQGQHKTEQLLPTAGAETPSCSLHPIT